MTHPMMRTRADRRRRWFGLLYLLLAGGMLIWGLTLLHPHLDGWLFILYWLTCFAFTFLAILVALLDLWIVRIRSRQQQNHLTKDVLNRDSRKKPRSKDAPPR